MKASPTNIQSLQPNQIFVFGSNEAGIHGAGAARLAWKAFGAKWGKGYGLHGSSFAIPTKDRGIRTMELNEIQRYVNSFVDFASVNPELEFLVTEIGCGLAGLTPEQVAPMFKQARGLDNVLLPQRFIDVLNPQNNEK